jgi:hypothetical protein
MPSEFVTRSSQSTDRCSEAREQGLAGPPGSASHEGVHAVVPALGHVDLLAIPVEGCKSATWGGKRARSDGLGLARAEGCACAGKFDCPPATGTIAVHVPRSPSPSGPGHRLHSLDRRHGAALQATDHEHRLQGDGRQWRGVGGDRSTRPASAPTAAESRRRGSCTGSLPRTSRRCSHAAPNRALGRACPGSSRGNCAGT